MTRELDAETDPWVLLKEARAETTQLMELTETQGAEIEQLRALVKDLAHDLEEELMGHYNGTLDYPSEQRRFERDMENVYRARAALQAMTLKDIAYKKISLAEFEAMRAEIERQTAAIAYVRQRSQRACEILNEFDNTRAALEDKP